MEPKFKNILWIEDYPDIVCSAIKLTGNHLLTPTSLLDRVNFAVDLESAERLSQSRDFDLYVSDGDFPDYAEREHCETVRRFLQEVRVIGPNLRIDPESDSGGDVVANYVNFYLKCLKPRNIKPIILSANILNGIIGFNLGLAYYCKGIMSTGEIRANVAAQQDTIPPYISKGLPDFKFRDLTEISSWECGNLRNFTEKYLL